MATLTAHRTETVIGENGELILDGLPFRAGETVEVIILPTAKAVGEVKAEAYPLRGLPIHYEKPFEPVAEEDWDASR